MSIESFIRAIPKVELHVQLEGAMRKETLLLIAEQNDIPENLKHFNQWATLLDNPDYKRLDDLVRVISQWLQLPEDLTRVVYELGVSLAKQNVCYAEVNINPLLYMEGGLTFEQFLSAINDGRDRVLRGWNVQLAWILTIPRDQPRKADDFIRWATSATAKKGGVVGLGLSGPENVQPVGQFERPFHSAEKKGIPRLPLAGDALGTQGLQDTVQMLLPDRIFHGWGAVESPELLRTLDEQHIPLCLTMTHELRMERIKSYAEYPLRKLLDEGVTLTLSTGMPELYKTTLEQEYLAAVGQCGVYPEELEAIALNGIRMSVMPEAQKEKMLEQFSQEYARLRAEHLTPEVT